MAQKKSKPDKKEEKRIKEIKKIVNDFMKQIAKLRAERQAYINQKKESVNKKKEQEILDKIKNL